MSALTPEGKLKQRCRKLCVRLALLWWNIEGKSCNGVPDTLVGLYPKGRGTVLIEFKRPGKEPTEQQWKRIAEARAAGHRAEWCDSYERFAEIICYELDL
jgi:hypothetical protein